MTGQTDPQVTEALQHLQRFVSAFEDDAFRTSTGTFTATDETETVTVTVNGDRWLTGLQIEPGLLRMGAETVQQRLNEALHTAQAATIAAAEDEEQQLQDTVAAVVSALQQQLGDLQQQP
ncbi:YbaB/EbfC family nucleoid-associated protein [Mycobacterium sp. 050272]|uniref:YbaB/EbfC family nucleoid-associated protein n=1 Tax=Mycobacterium sp. 050272 TaxID=3142488 RepID=UPI003190A4DE